MPLERLGRFAKFYTEISAVQDIASVDHGLIAALPYIVLPLSRMGFVEIAAKEQKSGKEPAVFACRLTPIGMEVAVALEHVGRYSTLAEFRRQQHERKSSASV